jgi:LPXTG-motif cell wall-anchored protein
VPETGGANTGPLLGGATLLAAGSALALRDRLKRANGRSDLQQREHVWAK